MPAAAGGDRSVADRLAERIEASGPIPVADYVEAALYDPDGGFYTSGGRAGRSGDFLTAPEVGGLFGAVLGRALDEWWEELGRPRPFQVVDVGAGPGTLTRSILAAAPAVLGAGALRWASVERSAGQRARHPEHDAVTSHETIPDPLGPAVVIANELFDNLAFGIVEWTGDGWTELLVGLDRDGRFALVEGDTARPDLAELDLPPGTRVPIQTDARRMVDDLHRMVPSGRIVVFDYGADTETLARRPDMGWLRVHRAHDDRGSWLSEPGSCDVTVDVAVDQITADHEASALSSQADFLRRHGIEELVAEGKQIWLDRAHIGDLEALAARSRISEAEALLDPAGMGAFFVAEWII